MSGLLLLACQELPPPHHPVFQKQAPILRAKGSQSGQRSELRPTRARALRMGWQQVPRAKPA